MRRRKGFQCVICTAVCLALLWGCSSAPSTQVKPSPSVLSLFPTPAPNTPSPSPSATPEAEPSPTPELSQREKKWQGDLEYLRLHYKRTHPDPFLYVAEEEFDFRLDQLKKRIPDLSDSDMYFEIAQIMAGFCDVHTTVTAPESVYERVFPFDLIFCGEKVYLYTYGKEYHELLEPYFLREIVAVNGVDMNYIRQKAINLVYPANTWCSKEHLTDFSYLPLPAFFDWVTGSPQTEYTFHILDEDGQVELVEIPTIPYAPETIAYNGYPECFSFPRSFLETSVNHAEYIDDWRGGYVYMAFPDMHSWVESDYQKFFDTATELLECHPYCKLVVDLRKNSGGYPVVQEFARGHTQYWNQLPIEKTYILTGGYTVSAAIDLCTVFKETMDGITVGEPTGQYPAAFGGAPSRIWLPNSQICVYIAGPWHQGLHPEDYENNENGMPYQWQNTVLPDVYVPLDAEDFRQGRDSLIEWVLEH